MLAGRVVSVQKVNKFSKKVDTFDAVPYLKGAVMLDSPHTDSNGDDRHEDEWNKDENPENLASVTLQLVTGEQLKHQ